MLRHRITPDIMLTRLLPSKYWNWLPHRFIAQAYAFHQRLFNAASFTNLWLSCVHLCLTQDDLFYTTCLLLSHWADINLAMSDEAIMK